MWPHVLRVLMVRTNDIKKVRWTIRQKYRETDGLAEGWIDGHISSTGHHWDPMDPNVWTYASRRCTPTLEINTITKLAKGPQNTGQMEQRAYYTTTQGI